MLESVQLLSGQQSDCNSKRSNCSFLLLANIPRAGWGGKCCTAGGTTALWMPWVIVSCFQSPSVFLQVLPTVTRHQDPETLQTCSVLHVRVHGQTQVLQMLSTELDMGTRHRSPGPRHRCQSLNWPCWLGSQLLKGAPSRYSM